jgi:uncharacterized membrane protein YfcA
MLDLLLPAGVSPLIAILLIALSFVTSAISAVFGLGGGVAMLGALAGTVQPSVIVAVHAVIQLGSNLGRAFVQRASVVWPAAARFIAGSVVGVAAGAFLFQAMPERLFLGLLGAFILIMAWIPKPKVPGLEKSGLILGGVISSIATMFVGATGPFVNAVLLSLGFQKKQLIATHAMCMTAQHALKAIAFGVIGFSFQDWMPLIAAMIASGFAGTLLGSRILDRMPEKTFAVILKALLTLIALDLLRKAMGIPYPF